MKPIVISVFVCCAFLSPAFAQKLPVVQKKGLEAPAGLKIDGKTPEWKNGFQAYNKRNAIYYSLANTADQLVLVVRTSGFHPLRKVIGGGITLLLRDPDEKQKGLALTYPLIPGEQAGFAAKIKDPETDMAIALPGLNERLGIVTKEILVTGIEGATDSILSVYNTEGIKAASRFDAEREYTLELSVPLRYFKQLVDASGAFSYRITLNGTMRETRANNKNSELLTVSSATLAALFSRVGNGSTADMEDLINPTYFSGTYKLAGKH